ncbi:MAG: argininosuccinate lyase [SAR324 cluster bacterium]|nr:argininosuccinate lyase [SAR324 cluster bacterium]MBL7034425.1 argininosuccinate lyase [SAR324 cluster bacterium]
MDKKQAQVWGNHLKKPPNEQNVLFCAGRDVLPLPMADELLLPYDIWTNRAHCIMLHKQGLIPTTNLSSILAGLKQLEILVESGDYTLDPGKEDVHINVEAFVTENQGAEAGGRMHIGRSRNDQSACDMRLYLRAVGLSLFDSVKNFAAALLLQAEKNTESVMPGFTHYQPAMVTTWGHWLCAYVQGLCRDLERLAFAISQVNRNPLGAAAAFGTSWPIDRQLTTELLAFEKIDSNTLDCIVSRWENEAQLAHTGAMLMNHLSIMAQDLIFLSHPYSGLLQIDDDYVTGSSIMPQKKNPDFAEVIKSKAALANGFLTSLLSIQKGGLSGYNRDTQATKYLIMDLVRECEAAPIILQGVFESLSINTKKMKEQCETGFMNSVDIADHLARTLNLAFRDCYHLLARAVKLSAPQTKITTAALQKALAESGHPTEIAEDLTELHDPQKILNLRQHQGSPSPKQTHLQIEELSSELDTLAAPLVKLQNNIFAAQQNCNNYEV